MPKGVEARPALRVVSCLAGREASLEDAVALLERQFGPVTLRSDPFLFEEGEDYYRHELGEGLSRTWLCFERLMPPDTLAAFRLATGAMEERFSRNGLRSVNLDPGYLDYGKLVLASLKEAPDKLYLGRGVWAHTCLRYRHGAFEAPDHSFADFRAGRYDEFMTEARELYRRLLKKA